MQAFRRDIKMYPWPFFPSKSQTREVHLVRSLNGLAMVQATTVSTAITSADSDGSRSWKGESLIHLFFLNSLHFTHFAKTLIQMAFNDSPEMERM
jgi:hypothetical protein